MKSTATSPIYQLKITLQEFQPPMWRRVQVPATISLDRLHDVLQIVMGWTNSHLHAFAKDGLSYGDSANDDFDSMNMIPEKRVTINRLLRLEGETMVYLYDFGDDWRHDVALEKILAAGPGVDSTSLP